MVYYSRGDTVITHNKIYYGAEGYDITNVHKLKYGIIYVWEHSIHFVFYGDIDCHISFTYIQRFCDELPTLLVYNNTCFVMDKFEPCVIVANDRYRKKYSTDPWKHSLQAFDTLRLEVIKYCRENKLRYRPDLIEYFHPGSAKIVEAIPIKNVVSYYDIIIVTL